MKNMFLIIFIGAYKMNKKTFTNGGFYLNHVQSGESLKSTDGRNLTSCYFCLVSNSNI